MVQAPLLSVCQRYKFRKQFTTISAILHKILLLLSVCQRYKFRKQFTTMVLQPYQVAVLLSVCQRYKFRKQFTTPYRGAYWCNMLLSVCQRYKFRKQFTTFSQMKDETIDKKKDSRSCPWPYIDSCYNEKKIATMIIPPMMPRTNPHITPGMTLFVTMKSISFSNLLFPISNTVFVLFNSILDRVDHYVRHQPVQFACHIRLQISVHILYRFFPLPFLPFFMSRKRMCIG